MAEPVRGGPKVLAIEFRPSAIPADWNPADKLIPQFMEMMLKVSQGRLSYQILNKVDVRSYPPFPDGQQYDDSTWTRAMQDNNAVLRNSNGGISQADYLRIIEEFKIQQAVNDGAIDEVWLFGGPYFGFYESQMFGKGAYWCNAPGIEMDSRLFIIMGFNYQRDTREMIHGFGHRAESMLAQHFGSLSFLQELYSPTPTEKPVTPRNEFEEWLLKHGTVHRRPDGKEYDQDEIAWFSEFNPDWFPIVADPNLGSDVTASVEETAATKEPTGFREIDKTPNAVSDQPEGVDRLNYSQYAEAFAKIVLNKETNTPLTVGIYGEWGQGKSFLMGAIRNAIVEEAKSNKDKTNLVDYYFVPFNAWTYSGTDHLWASLITNLYNKAEGHFGIRLQVIRLVDAIKRRALLGPLAVFIFYALLGLGLSVILHYPEVQGASQTLVDAGKAFGISVLSGSALAGIPLLWKTLTEFMNSLFLTRSKNLQNLAARPDFKAQIGIMADIKKEIGYIRQASGKNTRCVLFIDDLDRCDYRKAVEVLQAIMLLLADKDAAPFVIFLGLDARVIVRAIEETYGSVLVKAGINGYEYLDKIVQIPFVIPASSDPDLKNYLDSLLLSDAEKQALTSAGAKFEEEGETPRGDSTRPDAKAGEQPIADQEPKLSSTEREISVTFKKEERDAIQKCVKDLSDNPRKIKRIVNIYRFARLILPKDMTRDKVLHWFVMTERWPLHVAWIIEYIENDEQTKKRLKDKNILDVYKLAKNDIHSKEMDALLTIDADPELFEAFIKTEVFTVQEIKNLIPKTFNLNPAIRAEVNKQAIRKTEVTV